MTSVLFVCTGNICRSPTADGVLRAKADAAGLAVRSDSAGTGGWHIGDPPDARTLAHAAQRGYDLSDLRARKVEASDFGRFDHIFAMDAGHLRDLRRLRRGDAGPQPRLFLDLVEGAAGGDVPDPYFGGPAGFEQVLDLVEAGVEALIAEIARA